MPFVEAIRIALAQIKAQRLKSFFTLLGVMIGVMFLIAVVSVVEGMARYVEQDFAGKFLGVNTFNVRKFPDINDEVTEAEWKAWQRRPPVTVQDAEAIREALPPNTRWAIQDVRWFNPQTKFVRGGPQVIAMAVTPDYFAIKDLQVARGRLFNEQEEALGASVIVIGEEVASLYFPNLDPIGREIVLDRAPFQVIGVLTKQGTVFGLSLDRQVIAPFTSPMNKVTNSRTNLYGVVVQAPSAASQGEVQEIVRETMRKRRRLHPAEPDNFVLESSETALRQWMSLKKYLVLAGIVLPAIGLVVGAIVIMNIMLVAVAERTREIGIRKSLGARRRDILRQFLVESTTLSVVGAAAGVVLGAGLAKLVSTVSPLPTQVAPWSVVLSVG